MLSLQPFERRSTVHFSSSSTARVSVLVKRLACAYETSTSRSAFSHYAEQRPRALVPFDRSLASELRRYLEARRVHARAEPDDGFFVGEDGKHLGTQAASGTVRLLLCEAGLKPPKGRVGPRPYDFRHAFAVHRLERWYRAGVDLHTRLPWLSAYMGHDNILGTEKYLRATPWLMEVAARRLRRRLTRRRRPA